MHAQILPTLSEILPPLDEDNRKRLQAIRGKFKKHGRLNEIVPVNSKEVTAKPSSSNEKEKLIDLILDPEMREDEFKASL